MPRDEALREPREGKFVQEVPARRAGQRPGVDYLVARRLLRKLGTPGAIECDPVAVRLGIVTGTTSAADALLQLAQETLRPFAASHWTIVRRADIGGEGLKALAVELFFLMRRFGRERRGAIEAIAQAIEKKIGRAADERRPAPANALKLVGVGRNFLARRSFRALLRAERCFSEAAAIDAGCSDAWLGLADTQQTLGACLMREADVAFAAAALALARCEELEPRRAGVLALRGEFMQFVKGDASAAAGAYNSALEADERNVPALLGSSFLGLGRQDFAAADAFAQKAFLVDPASLDARTALGMARLVQRDFAAALGWFESTLEIEPDHYFARYYFAHALIGAREYQRCLEHLASFPAAERSIMVDAVERHARALAGDSESAWRYVRSKTSSRSPTRSIYARAVAYAGLGEAKAALSELERAVRAGEPFVASLAWDPLLGIVHDHPRFGALI